MHDRLFYMVKCYLPFKEHIHSKAWFVQGSMPGLYAAGDCPQDLSMFSVSVLPESL